MLHVRAHLCFLVIIILFQIRPGAAQATLDCSSVTDNLGAIICGDKDLRLTDEQMEAISDDMLRALQGTERQNFDHQQSVWRDGRAAQCIPSTNSYETAFQARTCLIDMYQKRFGELLSQPSFSCDQASRPIEMMLCDDPDLRILDGGMGVVYRSVVDASDEQTQSSWRENQRSWLKYRNQVCQIPDSGGFTFERLFAAHHCLVQIYKVRISDLITAAQGGPDFEREEEDGPGLIGMSDQDPASKATADRIIECYKASGGAITIQGMRDCAGVWVTPRALVLCVAETQCPVLPDTIDGNALLRTYLNQASLTKNSLLTIDAKLYPNFVDPAALANCRQNSVSPEALISCVLLPKVTSSYPDASRCIGEADDRSMANCLIATIPDDSVKQVVPCLQTGNPSSHEILSCLDDNNLSGKEQALENCVSAAGSFAESSKCITDALPDEQVNSASCLSMDSATARTACLESQFPAVGTAESVVNCVSQNQQAPGDASELNCLSGLVSGDAAGIAKCAGAQNDAAATDCLLALDPKLQAAHAAYTCINNAEDGRTAVLSCADSLIPGLDDKTRVTLGCVAKASNRSEIAACAAESVLPKDAARLIGCAASSQGVTDFAVCAAAPAVNEEWRIAAECAVQSGGQPYAFAGCTATRLTVRELTKCFNGQIGKDCYGPNNTIVKYYTNAFKDLTQGPGQNNEVVKAIDALGTVVGSIGDGASHFQQEIEKHTRVTLDDRSAHNAWKNVTLGFGNW